MQRLGELVMLHRLALQESEMETADSPTPPSLESDVVGPGDGASSMSTVYSDQLRRSSRPSSPVSAGHGAGKPSFSLPFRKSSGSSSESDKNKEDSLARWLRDGTVVYKSVGLGLMDLVVGMHLVKLANERQIGTRIESF